MKNRKSDKQTYSIEDIISAYDAGWNGIDAFDEWFEDRFRYSFYDLDETIDVDALERSVAKEL
jgi:hypothetical protein